MSDELDALDLRGSDWYGAAADTVKRQADRIVRLSVSEPDAFSEGVIELAKMTSILASAVRFLCEREAPREREQRRITLLNDA